ncbi:antibiotic biosynthesis monooxygenase [Nocardia sp. NEAU-G5]|uniref:Antibiotic biosynthesis monooxygenase n=1 Tax=Nocardia albiluteola TaxID=2842303 RepID=A0ABS6AUW3_9NOCA|nr:antibiotic biosynthesis monooxygenase [Nocardia albiluteola]MBU3061321.1 antibiotic biosynthesis monooxygenase [Nocardia albiluteola]
MTNASNPAVPDTDAPVTVINTMSVPAAQRDLFLERWRDSAQCMAAAAGFRRTRMFEAVGAAAEAVFVNVGDWDSGAALGNALSTPEWRELTTRIQNDLDLTARPAVYRLALELAPGEMLSR